MNAHGPQPPGAARGEALAADLQSKIEAGGLYDVVAAEYVPDSGRVRLVWRGAAAEDTLDVPAVDTWVDRLGRAIDVIARGRAR